MKKLSSIILILFFGLAHSNSQDVEAENLSKNYHLFLKGDLLYPTMSLFSQPTAFGASIELKTPSILALQVNGIYAFTNSSTVVQKDYQVIPEFRLDISNNGSLNF